MLKSTIIYLSASRVTQRSKIQIVEKFTNNVLEEFDISPECMAALFNQNTCKRCDFMTEHL